MGLSVYEARRAKERLALKRGVPVTLIGDPEVTEAIGAGELALSEYSYRGGTSSYDPEASTSSYDLGLAVTGSGD